MIVDTTVQEKAIAYPIDSRLLEVARKKLVLLARRHGIALRQSYARQGPALSPKNLFTIFPDWCRLCGCAKKPIRAT